MGAGSDRRIQLEVNLSGRFNARLDQVPLFKNAERSRQVISFLCSFCCTGSKIYPRKGLLKPCGPMMKAMIL